MTTIRVRIALAIDSDGDWAAYGVRGYADESMLEEAGYSVCEPQTLHWIECDVPVPDPVPTTIQGAIVEYRGQTE